MKELSSISEIYFYSLQNWQSVKYCWDGDGFLLYYTASEGGSFELPTFTPIQAIMRSLSGFVFYLKWSVIEVCTVAETF